MEAPIYHLDKVVKAKQEDMEDFDGPLDLILHLLSKNKIEIRDIQISELLDQYLAWMAQREELNLEVASEFVTMAAHLVYIKTRMLLSIDDEVALSEMEELMAALEEHKSQETYVKIKDITEQLNGRYEFGRDYLPKQPEPVKAETAYSYVHDRADILSAIRSVLARTDNKLPRPSRASWAGSLTRWRTRPVPFWTGSFSLGWPGSRRCSRPAAAGPRWWRHSLRFWSCARPIASIWPGRRRTAPSPARWTTDRAMWT